MVMAVTLPGILSWAIQALVFLIIIDIIISYCIQFGVKLSPYSGLVRGVRAIVNPILNPIRKILPSPSKTGGWDFSSFVAIILLNLLQNAIVGYAR